jgi:hypothetical protein
LPQQPPSEVYTRTGELVQLLTRACGAEPLYYQWYFFDQPRGAQSTDPAFYFHAHSSHTGEYRVVVSNSFGVVTSSVMRVVVDAEAPTISGLPATRSVVAGYYGEVSATVYGAPPPRLQWHFNGMELPGQTNARLVFLDPTPAAAGIYTLVASNSVGVSNAEVSVQVEPLAVFLYGRSFTAGTDNYLLAEVQSRHSVTFQWRRDGTNIPGADTRVLPFVPASPEHAGPYDVIASNLYGARTSAVAQVTVWHTSPFPGSYSHPQNRAVALGGDLALAVPSAGSRPISFQWYFEGATMSGATNSALLFTAFTTKQAGQYIAVASNAFGVATSQFRVWLITNAPRISFSHEVRAYAGETRVLHLDVNAQPAARLQWRFNGTPILGGTNHSLLLTNLALSQSGIYSLTANNAAGTASEIVTLRVSPRRALDEWAGRHPRPAANDLNRIAFGNGRYVATGEGGSIVMSSNALQWTALALGNSYAVQGLAFGNGVFLAVVRTEEYQNFLLRSEDGVHWTAHLLPAPNVADVTFANGAFHVLGRLRERYYRFTSHSGLHWERVFISTDWTSAVVFGNDVWVTDGDIAYSEDGRHFNETSVPRFAADVEFANGLFVAVGELEEIWTSNDGRRWLPRNSGVAVRLRGVAFGAGKWIAVGDDGTITTSTDNGATWTPGSLGTAKNLKAVLHDGTQWIITGNDGLIRTSTDGVTWTDRRGGRVRDLYAVVHTNGLYVAAGYNGTILTSTNATAWSFRQTPTSKNLHGLTYGAGQYVAVGRDGTIITSGNGIHWGLAPAPTTNYIERVLYAEGRFFAVGENATILSSSNAFDWELHHAPVNPVTDIESIAHGNGIFVAVGGYFPNTARAVTLWSTNGRDWNGQELPAPSVADSRLRAVTFGDGTFVAVGNDGLALWSADGRSWSNVVCGAFNNLRAVTYAAGRFVAVGNEGRILSSRDVTQVTSNQSPWQVHRSILNENFHDVILAENRFLLVANDGLIVQGELDALPVFSAPVLSNGTFTTTVRGGLEESYWLDSSLGLPSWTPVNVYTNNGAPGVFQISTNTARRFLRVRSQ